MIADKERIQWIDKSRALCTLYIVGFWHMYPFIEDFNVANVYTRDFALTALAVFYFLSGYCLGDTTILDRRDVHAFLKARLKYYPIYILSCISMMVIIPGAIPSVRSLILSLLGVSCILGPAPSTLWFYSLLLFYYMVTLVILYGEQKIIAGWGICRVLLKILTILGVVLMIDNIFGCVDKRTYYYMVAFSLGLIIKKMPNFLKLITNYTAPTYISMFITFYVILLILYLSLLVVRSYYESTIITGLIVSDLVVLFLSVISRFNSSSIICKFVAGGSLVSYLFHKQFYTFIFVRVGYFDYVLGFLVILPILLIISYVLQRTYMRLYRVIVERKKHDGTQVGC